MITMQNIADKAGVNKGTVSYVLNGKQKKARISKETCAHIKAIALELGYRPNELARSVATGRSNVIAFVSHETASCEYVGKILAGVMEEITEQKFSLKLYHLEATNSQNIAEEILQQRVDGVIFRSSYSSNIKIIFDEMKKYNIPCAFANSTSKSACVGVTTNDCAGVKNAVKHLVDLGHRRILHLSHKCVKEVPEYVEQRQKGYLAGMGEYLGKSAKTRIIKIEHFDSKEDKIIIGKIFREPRNQRPTAIICNSDSDAMEVLQIAYKMDIKVPDELSVIGYADLEMAKYAMVPLTTIAQPFVEMGKETANMLLEVINDKRSNVIKDIKNRKLDVKLIVRESTAALVK